MEVLWFGYMKEVVCNGDDLILNPLFNFEHPGRDSAMCMEGTQVSLGLILRER